MNYITLFDRNLNSRPLNPLRGFPSATLSAALAVCLLLPGGARAETETFDTYSTAADLVAAGWELSQMAPGYVTTTFPTVGSGKGLRLQASPVSGESPAVAIWYRTTEYTNFYLAADVVNWADSNQGIALLARAAVGDDPGSASGYMVNYNVAEWGDTPGTPRQGELQISVLYAPFTAVQLAIGEVTLDPGRPYRIVFTGAGFHFQAQVYDLFDLTRPLIQLQADDIDGTYTAGISGIMSFNRGDLGTTDVTLDNYTAAREDPNPATPPALAHPVPGTPTIDTRSPAGRFSNCRNPSDGIVFTATTYSSGIIDASATKMRLNGVDVSSQLQLGPDGPSITGTLPGSVLQSYNVYSAQIEVQDISGLKKSTNTFWFDTFSEPYLGSVDVELIEAEDYNYSNGLYQLDPIPVSGLDLNGMLVAGNGVGYFDLQGVEAVDFHDARTTPEAPWTDEFRHLDPVGLSQGMFAEIQDSLDPFGDTRYSDHVRNQYATNNMLEFVVHRTAAGEWLNYTRDFDTGSYFAWLRVASLGPTEVRLDRVTSDPALPGQATTNLGRFSIPNQFTRYNYRYIPLVNDSAAPVVLNLSGRTTLRLTMAGTPGQDDNKLAINYILFVPLPVAIHVWSSPNPAGPYTEEYAAIVNAATRTITVPASGQARFYRLTAPEALTIKNFTVSAGVVRMKY